MTKITEISRSNLNMLGTAFERELKEIGDKYGVTVKYGGGRYGGSTGEIKLRLDVQDAGSGQSGREQEFKMFAAWYDLQASDFGREFWSRGEKFRIVGVNRSAPKYPIICERVRDGASFKFTAFAVKTALGNATKRAA